MSSNWDCGMDNMRRTDDEVSGDVDFGKIFAAMDAENAVVKKPKRCIGLKKFIGIFRNIRVNNIPKSFHENIKKSNFDIISEDDTDCMLGNYTTDFRNSERLLIYFMILSISDEHNPDIPDYAEIIVTREQYDDIKKYIDDMQNVFRY